MVKTSPLVLGCPVTKIRIVMSDLRNIAMRVAEKNPSSFPLQMFTDEFEREQFDLTRQYLRLSPM